MRLILGFNIAGPSGGGNSFLSHLPFSWRISHILLCLTGVNNVYFVTSLPLSLRLASLIYHAAWLCLSTPLLILYIYSINWEGSITNIVEQVGMIIINSCILSLGTAYMVNALKRNRTSTFVRIWYSFCSEEMINCGEGTSSSCKTVRTILVMSTSLQCIVYVALMVRSIIISDLLATGSYLLHSLEATPGVLKVLSVIYMVLISFSVLNVTLTTCHFALVTLTLAEEFDKLYCVICKLVSSACTSIDVWEQVRFRHKTLVSLACLHSRLSTMMLGPIILGYVMYLCFTFYFLLAVYVGVIEVSNVFFAIAMLWAIIAPSHLLENQVSKLFIPSNIVYDINATNLKIHLTRIYLTYVGRDKITAISQTIFLNGFSWWKTYGLHWNLFLSFDLWIAQHWFR